MPNYHVTRLIIFFCKLLIMTECSFWIRAVSFDPFSHCIRSSLQPKSTLCVSRCLPKTGEMLFCSCYWTCHIDPPWSSVTIHSVVWSNVDSNHHTISFCFSFWWNGLYVWMEPKGEGKGRPLCNVLLKCAKSSYWQRVGWKSALHSEWAVGNKWCDSWWFKLKSFSLQLKWAQSTQAGYYHTSSEQWKLINLQQLMTFGLPSSYPQFLGPGPAVLCAISIELRQRSQQTCSCKVMWSLTYPELRLLGILQMNNDIMNLLQQVLRSQHSKQRTFLIRSQ